MLIRRSSRALLYDYHLRVLSHGTRPGEGYIACPSDEPPPTRDEGPREGPPSAGSRMRKWTLSPAFIAWAAVGLLIHLMDGFGLPGDIVQLLLGSAGLAHSVIGFWSNGRGRITAPNLYLFSTGLFVFFPAIYLIGNDPISFGQANIVPAVSVAYFAQIVLYHFFWSARHEAVVSVAGPPTDSRVLSWGTWMGLAMVVAGVALRLAGAADWALLNAAVFSGIALLSVASLRKAGRVSPMWYVVIALAFVAYAEYAFTGFGRLQLGALGLCVAIAAAHRWPGRSVKLAMVAATVPALMYFAATRAAFTATLNPAQLSSVSGLESVVSPLVRFAQLLELARAEELQYTYFNSLYATATFWVPRGLWADKPIGLGAELAHFFRPELEGAGHSELALFYGEWLFAFGLIGVVMMVPAIGLLVRWMDRILQRAGEMVIRDRVDLLKVVAITIACASLADLVWGGTFTFGVRVGMRLVVLFALYAIAGRALWSRSHRSPSGPSRQAIAGAPRAQSG